ncbi:MAG: zf-HC2 domain-containing protein [Actinomycetota bacterium]
MNCTTVRDRLTEHALRALPAREASSIDRHIAWCAACRKEAGDLQAASATLAFALAPEEPSPELEGRILEVIGAAAARRVPPGRTAPRRSRLALVAALAAMLAVVGTGWGAVMAGRAAHSDEVARDAVLRQQGAVERFRDLLTSAEFSDPEGDVFLGTLAPSTPDGGGGSALTLVSPSIIDMAIVLVNGVPPEVAQRLPFTVRLRGTEGSLLVGRLPKGGLDASGAGIVSEEFDLDLSSYDEVVVRDDGGAVVMRGAIDVRAAIASPSP